MKGKNYPANSIFVIAHYESWGSLQKSLVVKQNKTKENVMLIPINLKLILA